MFCIQCGHGINGAVKSQINTKMDKYNLGGYTIPNLLAPFLSI